MIRKRHFKRYVIRLGERRNFLIKVKT